MLKRQRSLLGWERSSLRTSSSEVVSCSSRTYQRSVCRYRCLGLAFMLVKQNPSGKILRRMYVLIRMQQLMLTASYQIAGQRRRSTTRPICFDALCQAIELKCQAKCMYGVNCQSQSRHETASRLSRRRTSKLLNIEQQGNRFHSRNLIDR